MRKAVFIIPGFRHLPSNKAYKQITEIVKNQGFLPIPVTIPWQQSITENTDFFLRKFKGKLEKKYILGFSYGALIAFVAGAKIKLSGLVLCSLSPFFKEDLAKERHPRYQDFVDISSRKLAKQIRAKKILMLYGEKEDRFLKNRVINTYLEIPSHDKYLISIKNTEHNIGDRRYLDRISQAIHQLN